MDFLTTAFLFGFAVVMIVFITGILIKSRKHPKFRTEYQYQKEQKKSFEYRQDDPPTFDPTKYQSITEEERQKHQDQYKNAWSRGN